MNCFQNTNFSEDSQGSLNLTTRNNVVNCFQNTNFSEDSQEDREKLKQEFVVNCFQNTNFSEDSQVYTGNPLVLYSCELLSEY